MSFELRISVCKCLLSIYEAFKRLASTVKADPLRAEVNTPYSDSLSHTHTHDPVQPVTLSLKCC